MWKMAVDKRCVRCVPEINVASTRFRITCPGMSFKQRRKWKSLCSSGAESINLPREMSIQHRTHHHHHHQSTKSLSKNTGYETYTIQVSSSLPSKIHISIQPYSAVLSRLFGALLLCMETTEDELNSWLNSLTSLRTLYSAL